MKLLQQMQMNTSSCFDHKFSLHNTSSHALDAMIQPAVGLAILHCCELMPSRACRNDEMGELLWAVVGEQSSHFLVLQGPASTRKRQGRQSAETGDGLHHDTLTCDEMRDTISCINAASFLQHWAGAEVGVHVTCMGMSEDSS